MAMSNEAQRAEKFKTVSNYIAMRLETDPSFAEKVKSNPKQTLMDLGVDEGLMQDNGATAFDCTCYDTTCWSSECGATCVGPSVTWTPEL